MLEEIGDYYKYSKQIVVSNWLESYSNIIVEDHWRLKASRQWVGIALRSR